MTNASQKYVHHFLKHPYLWTTALTVGWFAINIVVLATTTIMELSRTNQSVQIWQPFCWEISSQIIILLLIPVGIFVSDRWLATLGFKMRMTMHLILTIPFSAIHVAGMVGIRQLWYHLMGVHYSFGNFPVGFLYEYRKDAQTYLTIGLAILGYRFIVRRLRGEASYLTNSEENENPEPGIHPERLLIKKLGREFLIQTRDIEWIEASGNYANLHIKDSVYPMRITMDKLEKLLPSNFVRIHRSTIVNLEKVQEVESLDSGDHQVTLHNKKTLTLSRRYREEFKNLLRPS
ncbi:MAG: LytTR family transcriptional regulator [Gammaproteobacteria bacterium]|nr:MAG: LytTR family transcriptional regulator [Gammaproteobacteria bacterium]